MNRKAFWRAAIVSALATNIIATGYLIYREHALSKSTRALHTDVIGLQGDRTMSNLKIEVLQDELKKTDAIARDAGAAAASNPTKYDRRPENCFTSTIC